MISIYIALISFFCITDLLCLTIPNIVVIPAIFLGIYLTGYWLMALAMFLIGAVLFKYNLTGGGDVKLYAMLGAFLGIKAFIVLLIAKLLLIMYRFIFKNNNVLPFAPFLGIVSIPFIWIK